MTTICKHLLTVSFTLPLTVAIAQRNPSGPIATTPSSPAKRLEIIVPPRPINVVRPEYPRKDQKLKHGEGRLHATIGTDGAITDLRVVSGQIVLIEAARKSKYQGTCVLGTTVGRDGRTTNMWVVRPLGEGLDEKALDVLKRWRFEPATKDGKPVATLLNVEFQFRLY